MNLVDSKHRVGETPDDQRQLAYISDYEQPPSLSNFFEPLINVSSGKALSSSSSNSDYEFIVTLGLKPIFVKHIQIVPLKTFTPQKPQNDQAFMLKQLLIKISHC